MPKIRDLGISVIPVTMRPTEIGGGAAEVEYWAQRTPCDPTDWRPQPQCLPSIAPPCYPTEVKCAGTPDCCPTNEPESICSKEEGAGSVALPDGAVMELKQQLRQQMAQL